MQKLEKLYLCLIFSLVPYYLANADNTPVPPPSKYDFGDYYFFSFEDDRNWDKKPDFWERLYGEGYSPHTTIQLDKIIYNSGKYSLQVRVEKGLTDIISKRIKIDVNASYLLTCMVRKNNPQIRAGIGIKFYDINSNVLKTIRSDTIIPADKKWHKISLKIDNVPSESSRASIVCFVYSTGFTGKVWFDTIYMKKQPKMLIYGREGMLYTEKHIPRFVVKLGGLCKNSFKTPYTLDFSVKDFYKDKLLSFSRDVPTSCSEWQKIITLPIYTTGYYSIKVNLKHNNQIIATTEKSFCKLKNSPKSNQTSNVGLIVEDSFPLNVVLNILHNTGIKKLKVELSLKNITSHTILSATRKKLRRLRESGIEITAVITPKSSGWIQELTDFFNSSINLSKFHDMLTQLSLYITGWQIGSDKYPLKELTNKHIKFLASIFNTMKNFAYVPYLVIPVKTITQSSAPFLMFSLPLSYYPQFPNPNIISSTTLNIEPPSSLVSTHLKKIAKVLINSLTFPQKTIYLFPFKNSMIYKKNEVGPIIPLLYNIATILQNSKYFGHFNRANMINYLFEDLTTGKTIMVAWSKNENIFKDTLYLGDGVYGIKIIGDQFSVPFVHRKHILTITPMPIIYKNLNTEIARTRLSWKFSISKVYLTIESQRQQITLKNYFKKEITLRVRTKYPSYWKVVPPYLEFDVPSGKKYQFNLNVTPPITQEEGEATAKFDIDILADKLYNITIVRNFPVLSYLDIKTKYYKLNQEYIELSVRITNKLQRSVDLNVILQNRYMKPLEKRIDSLLPTRSTQIFFRIPVKVIKLENSLRLGARELTGGIFTNKTIKIEY